MRTVLLILLILALAMPAPAAIYRCRDKKGVLHLTDDPENFPPGCRPEGKQGETTARAGGGGAVPPPTGPTAPPGEPPAGSSGVPPGLNRPGAAPPSPQSTAGTPPGGESAPGISVGPVFGGWLEEARSLRQEYLESQTGPERPAGSVDPSREVEGRIETFRNRLDKSPLSPQERAAVEQELPPPRQ